MLRESQLIACAAGSNTKAIPRKGETNRGGEGGSGPWLHLCRLLPLYPVWLGENLKEEFLLFCTFLPFEEESCFPPGSQFTLEEITILCRSC